MSDILPFLKSMISVAGLSGNEAPIASLIDQRWAPLVDEIRYSRLGSLHGLKKGRAKSPRPSVMIATHMDVIGLMVTRVVDEFLFITHVGNVDARILPGTPVIVHASRTDEQIPGIVMYPPKNLFPEGKGDGAIGLEFLFIDTGLTAGEVATRINIGDLVSFDSTPQDLPGGCLSGHSLDNRSSIASLTLCLEELTSRDHDWDVWALASVQEEITYAGGFTSSFQLQPTIAVVVDMSYGQGTGTSGKSTFPIGRGVTLGIGASIHPFLHRRFRQVARDAGIPVVDEAMPTDTSTEADAIQISGEGIPTMVVGIPLRYMHTPVEVVALRDIRMAGRLLVEFVTSLELDFIERMVWD